MWYWTRLVCDIAKTLLRSSCHDDSLTWRSKSRCEKEQATYSVTTQWRKYRLQETVRTDWWAIAITGCPGGFTDIAACLASVASGAGMRWFSAILWHCFASVAETTLWTVNIPNCFRHLFYKTRPILIKFGTQWMVIWMNLPKAEKTISEECMCTILWNFKKSCLGKWQYGMHSLCFLVLLSSTWMSV